MHYLSKALDGVTFSNSMCAIGIFNVPLGAMKASSETSLAGLTLIGGAVLYEYIKEHFSG